MTSPSEQQPVKPKAIEPGAIEQLVNNALDQSNVQMPASVAADLAHARKAALDATKGNQTKQGSWGFIPQWLAEPIPRIMVPGAAAAVLAVVISYSMVDPIPALPAGMVTADIPAEDLAMLEDLEFVSWLAENEQDTLL